MWKLELPWMLLLLPLPVLVAWWAPPYRTRSPAVRMPFFHEIASAAGETPAAGGVRLRRNALQWLLLPTVWALVVLAAARPVWVGPPVVHELPARDLMLAIDLSQSMSTADFVAQGSDARIDRLTAVKHVVADFIRHREHDRIGLVVFGDTAYPQAPLTLDHDSVQAMLAPLATSMAGPRTSIGDAVGLAVKLLQDSPAPEKVLVLLTDGNDTASRIPPEQAARIAKAHAIVIHTIGIGDTSTTGDDRVDLAALQRVASITGGQSYQAHGSEADLADVYAQIDRLAPSRVKQEVYRPQTEYYWAPLGVALALATLYHVIALVIAVVRGRGRPRDGGVTGDIAPDAAIAPPTERARRPSPDRSPAGAAAHGH